MGIMDRHKKSAPLGPYLRYIWYARLTRHSANRVVNVTKNGLLLRLFFVDFKPNTNNEEVSSLYHQYCTQKLKLNYRTGLRMVRLSVKTVRPTGIPLNTATVPHAALNVREVTPQTLHIILKRKYLYFIRYTFKYYIIMLFNVL